jgi:hypothetical protein
MMKRCRRSLLWAGLLLPPAVLIAQNAPPGSNPQAQTAASAPAPAPANDADALAKATQNPVASLISVPIQNNSNFAVGPYNRTQDVLNIQPVIPARISENWMLISRIIQPIVWQPASTQPTGGEYGFGDMNPTFFLSPAKPGKLIWGVGPAMVFPTATSTVLGQGKLSFGPSVVALVQPGYWTLGFLVNNVWSVAGSSHRPSVNQMTLQYFITYNLQKGWNINSGPIVTANWHNQAGGESADGDDTPPGGRWTVPFGGGVGRVMRLGTQPVNLSANFYGNAIHPPGASSWGMRLQIALLYPQKPKS